MRKIILLFSIVTCFAPVNVFSQSFFSRLELEAAAATNISGTKLVNSLDTAFSFYVEGRYNCMRLPIDLGLQFSAGYWNKGTDASMRRSDYDFRNILLMGDYNFGIHRNVSLFAGAGIGLSFQTNNITSDLPIGIGTITDTDKYTSFCFMFRVGVEFFRVIRLTAGYKLMRADTSSFEISLGVTFGGWKNQY